MLWVTVTVTVTSCDVVVCGCGLPYDKRLKAVGTSRKLQSPNSRTIAAIFPAGQRNSTSSHPVPPFRIATVESINANHVGYPSDWQ